MNEWKPVKNVGKHRGEKSVYFIRWVALYNGILRE